MKLRLDLVIVIKKYKKNLEVCMIFVCMAYNIRMTDFASVLFPIGQHMVGLSKPHSKFFMKVCMIFLYNPVSHLLKAMHVIAS